MSDPQSHWSISRQELTGGLARLMQHFQRIGVSHLPRGNPDAGREALQRLLSPETNLEPAAPAPDAAALPAQPPAAAAPRSAATPSTSGTAPAAAAGVVTRSPRVAGGLPVAQRQQQLQQLAACVAGCTRCEILASTRTQTVFGEGDPQARVCFFGEAPGAEEDRQGRPFVGAAGQLLTKMIEACGMRREDAYILNTLKCRPPNNRNPEPAEVANCREYFEAQLAIVQPEYIVCLGLVAAQSLLDSKLSVGRLRGRFHDYRNSKVLVTYHPAYLLRNPSAKRAAWDDLKIMLRDMGVVPEGG